jgi:hypothetical protein
MRSIFNTVTLTLALATVTPMVVSTPTTFAAETQVQPSRKQTSEHLTRHQTYPATRAELLASCKNLMEFSDGEKRWFAAHLPEGTYNSADEVMKVLYKK